ncbi:hypothetical protein J4Q44_G00371270 [Coregonus suidteri]|uniref:Uncharacterized protein n=1 Tax=Coregonus suidteri TaxID=861788 RepID=A0AAN8KKR0_9TELE
MGCSDTAEPWRLTPSVCSLIPKVPARSSAPPSLFACLLSYGVERGERGVTGECQGKSTAPALNGSSIHEITLPQPVTRFREHTAGAGAGAEGGKGTTVTRWLCFVWR